MVGHIDLIMRWLKSPPSAGRDIFGIPKQPTVRNEMIILPRSPPTSASPPRPRDIVVVVLSVAAAAALCDSDNIPSINHFTRAHDRDISGMLFFFCLPRLVVYIYLSLSLCLPRQPQTPSGNPVRGNPVRDSREIIPRGWKKTEKKQQSHPHPEFASRIYYYCHRVILVGRRRYTHSFPAPTKNVTSTVRRRFYLTTFPAVIELTCYRMTLLYLRQDQIRFG